MRETCTVCDFEVDPDNPLYRWDEEEAYVFCSPRCLEEFDQSPDLYSKSLIADDREPRERIAS